jgi:hypothetical protein
VIVTRGEIGAVRGGDPEHPSQNGAGCPVLRGQHVGVRYREAQEHPGDSFPVFIGIVAAYVYVSLEQPL